MQIVIMMDDFDKSTGLPTGAFERMVVSWAADINESRELSIDAWPKGAKIIDISQKMPVKINQLPAKSTPTEVNKPPATGSPPADQLHKEPRQTDKTTPVAKSTSPLEKSTEKPKTRKRRTKDEINAADDAACQLEIVAAKREGREPDVNNLPADTQKRVGKNPKSWIDPQIYATIMNAPTCVPSDSSPPAEATPPGNPPAVPPNGDFSEFLNAAPHTDKSEKAMRFEIWNKLAQLSQVNALASRSIVEQWVREYHTTSVTEIPVDKLAHELECVERRLDVESK